MTPPSEGVGMESKIPASWKDIFWGFKEPMVFNKLCWSVALSPFLTVVYRNVT